MPFKDRTKRREWERAYFSRPDVRAGAIERNRALRRAVFDIYGGTCTCCGEHRYEFLALDHVNGGGVSDRRGRKNGNNDFHYRRIKRSGEVDSEFTVLCHNCNQAKGFYGECPHAREKRSAA